LNRRAGCSLALAAVMLAGQAECFTVSGRIHEQGTPYPVAGAIVRAVGSTIYVEADGEGRYRIEVPEGTQGVTISAAGFQLVDRGWSVQPGQDVRLDYALTRIEVRADEVVVRGRRAAAQVGQTEITREEIKNTPGTAGDALRAVQNLPGVIMPSEFLGQMAVRGGGPNDNLYLIDGIPWPVPFHFGGIMSTVNSELLKDVNLYAAGFDSRWGDSHGAVLDAHTRPGDKERFQGSADVNLVVSEGLVEGPLGLGDSSWSIGGRRSYFDLLFGKMFSDTFNAFPRFWDLGGSIDASLSPQDRVRGLALATDDLVGLKISEEMSRDSRFTGNFRMHNTYQTGGLGWTTTRLPGITSTLTPFAYSVMDDTAFGSLLSFKNRKQFTGVKEEASWEAGSFLGTTHLVGFGGDLVEVKDRFYFFLSDPVTGDRWETTVNGRGLNSGGYLQDRVGFADRGAITLGGRFDHSNRVNKNALLPRASAEWKADPLTTLRAAWGIYSQFPNGYQLNPDYGNPNLAPEKAQHSVLGVERQITRGTFGKVEVYHKWYRDLIVNANDTGGRRREGAWRLSNDGVGLARGVEVFLKQNVGEKFFGWLSYAYSTSKRRDFPGDKWALYEYDQPHVATLVGSYAFTPVWRLGAKVRYSSGSLITPVTGAYKDANDRWTPIHGPANSERLADYIRTDMRLEHGFLYSGWKLNLYFEVLNLFDRKNPADYQYNEDYSEKKVVNSMPRLYYLGLGAHF